MIGKENMNNLNFDCKKCGKCCKASPQLMDKEIIKYSDKFFIQVSHYSILSYEKTPLDTELINHYSKFCHVFYLPEKNCHLYYFVSLTAVSRGSEFCNQLENNLCNLQKDKPLFCKTAPLNIMMPEESQIKLFNIQWKPLIEKNIFACDIGDKAKTLISNNNIANYEDQEGYYTLLNNIKNLTTFYVKKVLDTEEKTKNHIQYCLNLLEKNTTNVFYSSALDLLNIYNKLGIITNFELDIFINNQINVINKDIEKALIKKDLNDRPVTNLLRKELERFTKQKLEEKNEDEEVIIV